MGSKIQVAAILNGQGNLLGLDSLTGSLPMPDNNRLCIDRFFIPMFNQSAIA